MDLVFIGFFSFFIHFMCNTLHSTRVHTLCVMLLFNFMLLGGTRGVRTPCLRASKRELITLSVVPLLSSHMPMANSAAHAICSLL